MYFTVSTQPCQTSTPQNGKFSQNLVPATRLVPRTDYTDNPAAVHNTRAHGSTARHAHQVASVQVAGGDR